MSKLYSICMCLRSLERLQASRAETEASCLHILLDDFSVPLQKNLLIETERERERNN